jgi:hypothetical protein
LDTRTRPGGGFLDVAMRRLPMVPVCQHMLSGANMPALIAFASLPFALRTGEYEVATNSGKVTVHVSGPGYNPFVTVTSRPELAQAIPRTAQGEGWTFYTWYDHPFVLRVAFGRNIAALGSINSCATILQPLPGGVEVERETTTRSLVERFSAQALTALNAMVSVVRREARLYHIADLRRDDIDISIRSDSGRMLRDDPLHEPLSRAEEEMTQRFDLSGESNEWYLEVSAALQEVDPVPLADELLMEAERALVQRFPRQTITTCHTAIETAASALLTRGMARRGLPDGEVDHLLSTKSLSSKLDPLLAKYSGFSLKQDNNVLWKSFNVLNDLRNDVVHRGKRPTVDDAAQAIGIARNVLAWLQKVRLRNR